ncbi:MAG TPA: NAD(P)/FAD-dependent oxidoreductase [Gemmataceae bacterium]|nr:NAD(P)/FAD-dependent oxidoreductase [Gemmataceae bacterium]
MSQRPLVIVGAGPAGMSAAIAAAEAGIRPAIVDENPDIGGQIYRQPPAGLRSAVSAGHSQASPGADLIGRFEALRDRIDVYTEASVYGLFAPRQLAILRKERWETLDAEHLILAPGAHEYVPPFPGWTLPGVMTPGAAQALVKTQGVLPGRRALVAGTGPFLLIVAEQLHRAGVDVVGVVEMASRAEAFRAVPGMLAQPRLLWEGWRSLRRLKRAGIAVSWAHVVIEARGEGEVGEAIVAPCDEEGHPDRAAAKPIAVDTLCVGYGFVPRIQLAQLAGCRLEFNGPLGGWVPQRDHLLQSSQPGVWVAGDGAGVGGALVARLEGTLAGLAVARCLGALHERAFQRAIRPLGRRLARLRRFRAALDRLYRLRPGLTTLATAETVVCRCEELTRAEVEIGIESGGADLRTLKVMTRLGMGPCQGLMCWPAMAGLIAARTGKTIEEIGPPSPRPPLTPVSLASLTEQTPSSGSGCQS